MMQDQIDRLIVKVSPLLLDQNQMNSYFINKIKDYTNHYFKVSPNAYLIDNEFYQDLTETLKIKLVKDYITDPKIDDATMLLN
tara:strand:+ start:204 stop:452 length:249 start_codon:yes stop_codon:yes gene_type:complete